MPIIGRILGGGANEGLIGVTFQVAGSLEKPVLRVNPMSVVAPGFLRKLFEFREGEADLGAGRAPAASPEGDGAYPPAPAVDPTRPTAAGPPLPLARPSR